MSDQSSLSLEEARRIALNAQCFNNESATTGKHGIADIVTKLGYIQIDTIAVIQRAHHHTLWTRQSDYAPAMLDELQAKDRRVFEYWGHAASYLPMTDYRFYIPRMQSFYTPTNKWIKERQEKCEHLAPAVLERIRAEGPLCSHDFKPRPGVKRTSWWDWKPEKSALELLFWRGELMISERRNFQRYYDLTERVLPDDIDTRKPDTAELGRFLVFRALGAYGVAREQEILKHIGTQDKSIISEALKDLVDEGAVVTIVVEHQAKTFYARPEVLNSIPSTEQNSSGVFLLSPFDNLIIQRDRTNWLFGFDYTLECYVPAAKRQYGYFVLPVLWQNKLVARLDATANRKQKQLRVHKLMFEPDFKDHDGLLPAFARTLQRFMIFNGCDTCKIAIITPRGIAKKVRSTL